MLPGRVVFPTSYLTLSKFRSSLAYRKRRVKRNVFAYKGVGNGPSQQAEECCSEGGAGAEQGVVWRRRGQAHFRGAGRGRGARQWAVAGFAPRARSGISYSCYLVKAPTAPRRAWGRVASATDAFRA